MSDWYLRKPSGEIYGPKGLSELVAWATDGRIAPDDELSSDQKNWKSAPSVPELGLLYGIQLEDRSTYGPVHMQVINDLLLEGDIQSTTLIQHSQTAETRAASDWLIPYLVQQRAHDRNTIDDLRGQLESAERRLESAEISAAKQEDTEPTDVRDIPKEVLKWQRLYQTERDQRMEAEDRLQKQILNLKTDLQSAYSEKDRSLYRASQAEKKLKRLRQANETQPSAAGEGGIQGSTDSSVNESYQRLRENYDEILKQLQDQNEELTRLRAVRPAQRSSAADLRVKEMEEQLAYERSSRDDALARLADLEQTHMKLLKSFRDMNDQFIRLRDQQK